MTVLGHAAAALRLDPRGRHERQVVHRALHRRRSSSGTACAPGSYTSPHLRSFRERIEVGEAAGVRAGLRRGGRARGARRGAGGPHADRGRPGHAVRGAHRRRLPRAGAPRGGGGGDRGRPRRPLRRHQRDPVAGAGAHRRRPRAHALARAHARGHRRGEARGGARPRHARGAAGLRPGGRGTSPSAWRASGTRGSCGRRAAERRAAARGAARFQRRNFALAAAAAEAFLGRALDPAAVARGRRETRGARPAARWWADDPLDAPRRRPQPRRRAARWREALAGGPRRAPPARGRDRRARRQGRRRRCCARCCRASTASVFTRCANPRSLSPATLDRWPASSAGRRPRRLPTRARPLERARELAGPGGAVLATGSIYLIADLVRASPAPRAPRRCERRTYLHQDLFNDVPTDSRASGGAETTSAQDQG